MLFHQCHLIWIIFQTENCSQICNHRTDFFFIRNSALDDTSSESASEAGDQLSRLELTPPVTDNESDGNSEIKEGKEFYTVYKENDFKNLLKDNDKEGTGIHLCGTAEFLTLPSQSHSEDLDKENQSGLKFFNGFDLDECLGADDDMDL